jgi:hypothetical protein
VGCKRLHSHILYVLVGAADMKLIYEGNFKPTLLMDELIAEFPEWLIDDPIFPNQKKLLFSLEVKQDKSEIYITVPDDADKNRINKLIEKHDFLSETDYEKLVKWIRENLQPAVGKDVRTVLDLDTVQGKINVAILFSIGAINPKTYLINPLREWLIPE